MMSIRKVQIAAALIACLTWIVPVREVCATPPTARPAAPESVAQIHDIALDGAGTLTGQVFDVEGRLMVAAPVELSQGGQVIAVSTTDAEGRFAITGLRGGLYQVMSYDTGRVCRAWVAGTAPPSAKPSLLLTAGGDVERGKGRGADLLHPLLIGLIIAAAIAIPIALHKSKKPRS